MNSFDIIRNHLDNIGVTKDLSKNKVTVDLNNVISPIHQVTYEGRAAYIKCQSTTVPKWTKKGLPVPSGWIMGYTLVINLVSLDDSGVYTCHGTADNKGAQKFKANSKLLVGGKTALLPSFFIYIFPNSIQLIYYSVLIHVVSK